MLSAMADNVFVRWEGSVGVAEEEGLELWVLRLGRELQDETE